MHLFSLHRWAFVACRATSWKLSWAALMLATQRGERLSRNDEGVKKTGWGPEGFASACVSTETQNSGRKFCLRCRSWMSRYLETCSWHTEEAESSWTHRGCMSSAEKCPNKTCLCYTGAAHSPGGPFFLFFIFLNDCKENVTQVKLLERKVKKNRKKSSGKTAQIKKRSKRLPAGNP